jgi:hypothetical protein
LVAKMGGNSIALSFNLEARGTPLALDFGRVFLNPPDKGVVPVGMLDLSH